jgi:hypothetical protein
LYPQKRAKKQRSARTQLTSPHSQPTDFGALVLKKQALMPISNMSGTPGAVGTEQKIESLEAIENLGRKAISRGIRNAQRFDHAPT